MNDNILKAAVIQNAAIPVDGLVNLHVNVDPGIDHAGIGDTELELVEVDFLLYEFTEQFDLHWILVADPKIFDLAAGFQDRKRLGDLFRFHQGIRAMQ